MLHISFVSRLNNISLHFIPCYLLLSVLIEHTNKSQYTHVIFKVIIDIICFNVWDNLLYNHNKEKMKNIAILWKMCHYTT